MEHYSSSVQETEALGRALAQHLTPGTVVAFTGDLGAGKTAFVRGMAQGLGIAQRVTSPTFTILQVYDSGRLPLYHFDWYRLNGAEELYELAMDEYLQNGGVAVVEWPGRAQEAVPERYLQITLEPAGEGERVLTLTPVGGFHDLDWKGLV